MVTLRDIAKEAGVSVMTVSRVVNGVPVKVSESNRMKIQDIIRRRGYVPNSSARSLSSRRSRLVAIILPETYNALEYPHNALMVGHITRLIQNNDYTPLLCQVKNYNDLTQRLKTWNVDGAIFLGLFDSDMKALKEDNRIPLVFTDSYSSIRQVTNVGLDDFKGGVLAAEYLIDMGHVNMAFVGESSNESPVVRARYEGFASILAEKRIAAPPIMLNSIPDKNKIQELCLGRNPVTAFFAHADITAVQLMRELRGAGLSIPEDCSVIGFDNISISELCYPALTTIGQDIAKKAQAATDLLFRHIKNPDSPAENITLDVTLVVRESVRRM